MKKEILVCLFLVAIACSKAVAQDNSLATYKYCKCIEEYSYDKHRDQFPTSGIKCFKAWKKEMKRKKKECQAKALEQDRPMAARRKRREGERKALKRDHIEQVHGETGNKHDYWY